MISEQYKQKVWREWEQAGFPQPETKEKLDINIELQSRGQTASKAKRTVPKTANEVKRFDEMMNNAFDY